MSDLPNVEGLHEHLFGMFDGKMGKLAKEIAAETAEDLNLDMENVTDVKDLFQKLFSDPGKLIGMFKNIGEKIETKMKDGEIKQTELMSELTEMMQKMKGMPGMNIFKDMLGKMTEEEKLPPKKTNARTEWKQKVATKKLLKEFQNTLHQQQQVQSTILPSEFKEPKEPKEPKESKYNNILDEELMNLFSNKKI